MDKTSRLDGSPPLLDHVHLDYIRLATFDFKLYCELSASIHRKYTGWRKTKWLQYKMEKSQDNVSYGAGEQNDRAHGIFEATGSDSHIFLHWLLETQERHLDALYATRIDLCCTRTAPAMLDYVKTWKRLAKPKHLRLGDDGNTLYIGSRNSDSFWRLYDKTRKHVRLEVELKGTQAKRFWRAIVQREQLATLYNTKLKASRVPRYIADHYGDAENVTDMSRFPAAEMTDMVGKVKWLSTLDSLVYKVVNDHDAGPMAKELISRWSDYAELT